MACLEPGAAQRQWSVDDILADPLGYQRFVDTRAEEDAEAWVDQWVHELAEARQRAEARPRPRQTFLARVRRWLSRLFWRGR